jgi:Uncharacterized protein conserved in bacteria
MRDIHTYSNHLKLQARTLRKNMTVAEQILWYKIRRRQICDIQFLRQKPIQCYILDFYAKVPNLAIEVDGAIHNTQQASLADSNREHVLRTLGIQVIRFSNEQVLNDLNTVLEKIKGQILKLLANTH